MGFRESLNPCSCMQSLSMCMAVFLGGGLAFAHGFKEALSPSKDEEPQLWRHKSLCPESHRPRRGAGLKLTVTHTWAGHQVICFLIPTKTWPATFPFSIVWFSLSAGNPHGEVRILNLTSYSGKKKILETRGTRTKSKMGVVGGTQQWEENAAGKINRFSALTLSGTWPRASPLLGFSASGAPAVWSCLCPVWTRGWVRRGAGGPTRWNCSWSPGSGRRWCLRGRCRLLCVPPPSSGFPGSGSAAAASARQAPACCG